MTFCLEFLCISVVISLASSFDQRLWLVELSVSKSRVPRKASCVLCWAIRRDQIIQVEKICTVFEFLPFLYSSNWIQPSGDLKQLAGKSRMSIDVLGIGRALGFPLLRWIAGMFAKHAPQYSLDLVIVVHPLLCCLHFATLNYGGMVVFWLGGLVGSPLDFWRLQLIP